MKFEDQGKTIKLGEQNIVGSGIDFIGKYKVEGQVFLGFIVEFLKTYIDDGKKVRFFGQIDKKGDINGSYEARHWPGSFNFQKVGKVKKTPHRIRATQAPRKIIPQN